MSEKQLAFYFNASECSGCKTCQVACKDKNNNPAGILWRRVYEVTGGDWEQNGAVWNNTIFSWNVSVACNHCINPICLRSCPNKAITKNASGVVYIESQRCMGCRYCEWSCPYGALQFHPVRRVMSKCDLCIDYLNSGQKPACVDACPMRVLEIGLLENLKQLPGTTDQVFPFPPSEFTQPAIVIKPKNANEFMTHASPQISNAEEVRL